MRVTVKERILLHLLESVHSTDAIEVSPRLTQSGLAEGVGIQLRHLAQFLRPLIRDGLVRERTAHVRGKRQRMKVYALTQPGRAVAVRLRDQAGTEAGRIRENHIVEEKSGRDALQGDESKTRLLAEVRQVEQAEILDMTHAERLPESGHVEHLSDAPRTATFVGRRQELADLTREDGGPQVFVIRGIAGIGKTALASRACDLVRGRRNLFWHRIRPWESGQTILARLGRFLEALDRPGLSSVLRRGEVGLAAEVLRQDLPDTHAFLVFDDAHEASRDALSVLRMLMEAAASAPGVKVLLLTRRALSLYDARDTVIRGVVRELELEGLDPIDAASLLEAGVDSARLAGLGRRLAGHPLLLELVRSHGSNLPGAVRDVHRFIDETIYRDLSEAERITMKGASLYRVPVPRESLLAIPGSSYEALLSLQERSLLRFTEGACYEVHDTIRDFFGVVLTPAESLTLGRLAVRELRALAYRMAAGGDPVSGIACLANASRLSVDVAERAEIFEGLGDADSRLGDVPAALIAYRQALRLIGAPAPQARLHRKMADVLQMRGETRSACTEVEEGFGALGGHDDVEAGWLSLVRARMSITSEDWARAHALAQAALETFRSFDDARGQAEALVELSVAETNSPEGQPAAARTQLDEALALAQSLGDPVLAGRVHVQFANLEAYRLGDPDHALRHLATVESQPRALVDVRSRQSLLLLRGWLNLDLRADFAAARASFEEALALSKKTHDRSAAASARFGAVVAVYHEGDVASARHGLEAVAKEFLEVGSEGPAVEAFVMAAELCLIMGDVPGYRAISAVLDAPELARGLQSRPVMAHALQGLDCLDAGDGAGAHAAFRAAISDAEREASPPEHPLIAYAHDLYFAALLALGEDQAAAVEEHRAIEACERFGLKGRLVARVQFKARLHGTLRQMVLSAARAVPRDRTGGHASVPANGHHDEANRFVRRA